MTFLAEASASGHAFWAANGHIGSERTNADIYHQKWHPWILGVSECIAKNKINNGGPVILSQHEKELQETVHEATNTLVKYMEQIAEAFDDASIIVPNSHNEKEIRSQR